MSGVTLCKINVVYTMIITASDMCVGLTVERSLSYMFGPILCKFDLFGKVVQGVSTSSRDFRILAIYNCIAFSAARFHFVMDDTSEISAKFPAVAWFLLFWIGAENRCLV